MSGRAKLLSLMVAASMLGSRVPQAWARSLASCDLADAQTDAALSALTDLKDEAAAVTAEQIQAAPCRGVVPSQAAIQDWIKNSVKPSERKVSRVVHGISIENEDESLVNALEELLTVKGKSGRIDEEKSAKQKTFNSQCKSVMCVITDPLVFEPNVGPKVLYLLKRYGVNASHHIYEPASALSEAEISDVLQGLSDLPQSILPMPGGVPLVRYQRGKLPPRNDKRVDTIGDESIRFFDRWEALKPELRQSSLLHELVGHRIGSTYDLDESLKWLGLSQWKLNAAEEWISPDRDIFVGLYAQFDPYEDLAESVETYRYNPSRLKAKHAEKYNFIRDELFDGVEYTSETACQKTPLSVAKTASIRSKIPALFSDVKRKKAFTDAVFAKCGNRVIYEKMKGKESTQQRKSCVQTVIAEKLLPGETRLVRDRVAAQIELGEAEEKVASELVQARFKEGMQEWLVAVDRFNQDMNVKDCEGYARYAYRHLKPSSLKVVLTSSETFAFNNKDPLNALAREFCEFRLKAPSDVDSARQVSSFLQQRF